MKLTKRIISFLCVFVMVFSNFWVMLFKVEFILFAIFAVLLELKTLLFAFLFDFHFHKIKRRSEISPLILWLWYYTSIPLRV